MPNESKKQAGATRAGQDSTCKEIKEKVRQLEKENAVLKYRIDELEKYTKDRI